MLHVVDELQHGTQNYGLISKTYEWADGISTFTRPYICEMVRKCHNFIETIIVPCLT